MCRRINTARGQAHLSWLSGFAGLMVVALVTGCSSGGGLKKFELSKSNREYMAIAVSEQPADVRREAVAKVAESWDHNEPWAVNGFKTIALLDGDTQTRCVALRALGECKDPNATLTLVQVLRRAARPDDAVREPSEMVRWDAAKVLADRLADERVIQRDIPVVVAVLGERLRNDASKHVRADCARGLGYCIGEHAVFDALFTGLDDDEFSVVYACEDALIALTGVTHDADPRAWRAWYAENRDLAFAHAGEVPESRQRHKWHERWRHTKRFMGMER